MDKAIETTPAPAWRRRSEHRPVEIQAAARKLFEERGFEKTSLSDVAEAAGVSEATIYKYFDSKQSLVYTVIESWMGPLIDELEVELAKVPVGQAQIVMIAARHLNAMAAFPKMHELVYRELRWERYRGSTLHMLNRRYSRIVSNALDLAVRAGEILADLEPPLLQDILFGALEHVGLRMIFAPRSLPADYLAHEIVRQIFGLPAAATSVEQSLVKRLEAATARLEALAKI